MPARVSLFLLLACVAGNRATSESLSDNATCVTSATRWGEYFIGGDGSIIVLDRHGNITMTYSTTA